MQTSLLALTEIVSSGSSCVLLKGCHSVLASERTDSLEMHAGRCFREAKASDKNAWRQRIVKRAIHRAASAGWDVIVKQEKGYKMWIESPEIWKNEYCVENKMFLLLHPSCVIQSDNCQSKLAKNDNPVESFARSRMFFRQVQPLSG